MIGGTPLLFRVAFAMLGRWFGLGGKFGYFSLMKKGPVTLQCEATRKRPPVK